MFFKRKDRQKKKEIRKFASHFIAKRICIMKKILFLLAGVFACHAAQAQYFCTAEGTKLHYVNYDEVGQSTSDEEITVKNVTKEGNTVKASYYDKIVTVKTKNNTSYTLYNWTYDGTVSTCTEDLMYGPYVDSDSDPARYDTAARLEWTEKLKFKGDNSFSIKDGAEAGENLPDRKFQWIRNMLKNDVTISGASYMGTEQVNTRAGKFNCVKISYLKRTKIILKTTTLRVNEWYAEGVGLVKSEAFKMDGEQAGKTLLVKVEKN